MKTNNLFKSFIYFSKCKNICFKISKLKEIIDASLKAHGIKTLFRNGVTEYAPNNFVLLSKNAPLSELFRTPYSVDLFRRSMFDESKVDLLSIYNDRCRTWAHVIDFGMNHAINSLNI